MTTLVAITIISAQETTPGHSASTTVFSRSMNSYPLTLRLEPAVFSVDVPLMRMDASQPYVIFQT